MKNSSVIFIESNTSGTGRLFAQAAEGYGYRPVLLAETPERYPYLKQDSVAFYQCNTSSLSDLCSTVDLLSRETEVAGIFSSSEYFIETAAAVAQKFGLSAADPAALQSCRNKWVQRKLLQSAGLNVPAFERLTSLADAREALQRIPLPVVLKPTMGTGSVGVRLCSTADEVLEHAVHLLARTVNERGMAVPSELLLEQFVQGPEYSVETFGGEVIGITRKHVSPEPFFVELGHDFPAVLALPIKEQILATVKHALRAMGLGWGPAHIELRLAESGLTIIEINPRLAGGFIPEIVRLALGVDIIRQTVRQVVGDKPELSPRQSAYASIRFLVPAASGIIRNFAGLDEAWKVEGVKDIQTYRKVGDRVQLENDFRDRIGHLISCADLQLSAVQSAELARSKIQVQVEPQ
jgi:argininosuccinate lyase